MVVVVLSSSSLSLLLSLSLSWSLLVSPVVGTCVVVTGVPVSTGLPLVFTGGSSFGGGSPWMRWNTFACVVWLCSRSVIAVVATLSLAL